MADGRSKFPLIAPDSDPTAQEVFDAAAQWLLAQPEPCMTEAVYDDDGEAISSEYCCYRSADGLNACAVGAFMPDAFARLVDQGGETSVTDILEAHADSAPVWFEKHQDLLVRLQGVHDSSMTPRPVSLARVANECGLVFSPGASS